MDKNISKSVITDKQIEEYQVLNPKMKTTQKSSLNICCTLFFDSYIKKNKLNFEFIIICCKLANADDHKPFMGFPVFFYN